MWVEGDPRPVRRLGGREQNGHGSSSVWAIVLRPRLRAAGPPPHWRRLRTLDPRQHQCCRGAPPGARTPILGAGRSLPRIRDRSVPAGRGSFPAHACVHSRANDWPEEVARYEALFASRAYLPASITASIAEPARGAAASTGERFSRASASSRTRAARPGKLGARCENAPRGRAADAFRDLCATGIRASGFRSARASREGACRSAP